MTDTSSFPALNDNSFQFVSKRIIGSRGENWNYQTKTQLAYYLLGIGSSYFPPDTDWGTPETVRIPGLDRSRFLKGDEGVWLSSTVRLDGGNGAYWLMFDVEDFATHHAGLTDNIKAMKNFYLWLKERSLAEGLQIGLSGSGGRFVFPYLVHPSHESSFAQMLKSPDFDILLPGTDKSPLKNRMPMRFAMRTGYQEQEGAVTKLKDGRPRCFTWLDKAEDVLNLSSEEYERLVYAEPDLDRLFLKLWQVLPDGRFASDRWHEVIRDLGNLGYVFSEIGKKQSRRVERQPGSHILPPVSDSLEEAVERKCGVFTKHTTANGMEILRLPECPECPDHKKMTSGAAVDSLGRLSCFYTECRANTPLWPHEWGLAYNPPREMRRAEADHIPPACPFISLEECREELRRALDSLETWFINISCGAGKSHGGIAKAIEVGASGGLVVYSVPTNDMRDEMEVRFREALSGVEGVRDDFLFILRSRGDKNCVLHSLINEDYSKGWNGRALRCSHCDRTSNCDYFKQFGKLKGKEHGVILMTHAHMATMPRLVKGVDLWFIDEDPKKAFYQEQKMRVSDITGCLNPSNKWKNQVSISDGIFTHIDPLISSADVWILSEEDKKFEDIGCDTGRRIDWEKLRAIADKIAFRFKELSNGQHERFERDKAGGITESMHMETRFYATHAPETLEDKHKGVSFLQFINLDEEEYEYLKMYVSLWALVLENPNKKVQSTLSIVLQQNRINPQALKFLRLAFGIGDSENRCSAYAKLQGNGSVSFHIFENKVKDRLPGCVKFILDGSGCLDEYRAMFGDVNEVRLKVRWQGPMIHIPAVTTKSNLLMKGREYLRLLLRSSLEQVRLNMENPTKIVLLCLKDNVKDFRELTAEEEFKGIEWGIVWCGNSRGINKYEAYEAVIHIGDYILNPNGTVDLCEALNIPPEKREGIARKWGIDEQYQGVQRVRGSLSRKVLVSCTRAWNFGEFIGCPSITAPVPGDHRGDGSEKHKAVNRLLPWANLYKCMTMEFAKALNVHIKGGLSGDDWEMFEPELADSIKQGMKNEEVFSLDRKQWMEVRDMLKTQTQLPEHERGGKRGKRPKGLGEYEALKRVFPKLRKGDVFLQ
ncbi:hypothetical protein [Fundidesulfovibrio putealis]|uniref:hypothetical protein n=1 Tax=Fundidesulfovibrio putealis TaxID=270496 RepID=UPI00042434A3|nr:hypothetical protein [Fundidesulfovibrio putealis]